METQYPTSYRNALSKSLLRAAVILITSLASFVAQANSGSSASIDVSITKLPPLTVNAFTCDQGVCASINASGKIKDVVCDTRLDQLPACMFSPE